MTHRAQIEVLEYVQHLQERRTLADEAMLIDCVISIAGLSRRLDAGEELCKVGERERRAVVVEERDHLAGDITSIEAFTRRDDACFPAISGS